MDWAVGQVRALGLGEMGQRYRRYRLVVAEAEEAMARSLRRYGQLSPVVVCLVEERVELIDGFTRQTAAQRVGLAELQARRIEADERTAKAAIYGLNQVGRHTQELEEAWIVQALVREDGLSQEQAGELLGRHKSWVCRRLALIERLEQEVLEELRLGLLRATAARELTRLPAGNQLEVVAAMHREGLNSQELHGVVDLVLAAGSRAQIDHVLKAPREVLAQQGQVMPPVHDVRLSAAGNRLSRQVAWALEPLGRLETRLRQSGLADLSELDRKLLREQLVRLGRQARRVGDLVEELGLEEP